MSIITVFCQGCGEPNSSGLSNCTNCEAPLEAPSKDFLAENQENQVTGLHWKTFLPGVKAGAIAGVVSGLFWGLPKGA